MRILVCGDRNWVDQERMDTVLDSYVAVAANRGETVEVIEGEARGADSMAASWAQRRGLRVYPFPADWKRYRRGAGPIRNQQMLDFKPDLVVAFHNDLENSKGTKDMVTRAENAGVVVNRVTSLGMSCQWA